MKSRSGLWALAALLWAAVAADASADWQGVTKVRFYPRQGQTVRKRLDEAHGGKRVLIVPAGPALATLKTEMDAGRVPGMTDFFGEMFADGIHLKPKGRYLVSLVHYACIFRQSPQGKVSALTTGLTDEQALIFQRIAWDAVKNCKWAGVAPLPED